MAGVKKGEQETVRKDVEFVAKDDEQQVATGIVMVPDKVDLQHDFVREDTIREFAEQFSDFEAVGQADGGVMHAVWPDDHIELESQTVLDESQEIGGVEAPAGAWIQQWKFVDDELWGLVQDGILEGYSIGAVDVEWNGPFEQDELDDVAVPDEIDEEAFVWELARGIIREVSAVDIPAVPDAMILETKDAYEKRLADHLGNRDGFIEEALARGHTQEEAERLWEYLNGAVDIEGSGEPGKTSYLERIGKTVLGALAGYGDAPDPHSDDVLEASAEKEGRTLSQANRDAVMASIDAGLDVLHDAGVDDIPKRFTDRDDVDFDLTEHSARTWVGDHGEDGGEGDEEEEDAGVEVLEADHAPEGDTSDSGSTEAAADMTEDETTEPDKGTDTDDESKSEALALAEQNAEQVSELTNAVQSLTEALTGPQPETVEFELEGETYEVPEEAVKDALGVDEEAGVDVEAAIKALKDSVEEQERRLDVITRQSGTGSQQLEQAAAAEENGEDPFEDLAKALGSGA